MPKFLRKDAYVLCEVRRENGFTVSGYRRIAEGTREDMERMQKGLELDTVILPPFQRQEDGTMLCGEPSDVALFFRGYFCITENGE